MAQKYKDIKAKYQSQNDLVIRLNELLRIVKVDEVSLNVDSLTGQKVDPRVTGIIFSELSIINKIEIMSDNTSPALIDKIYQNN